MYRNAFWDGKSMTYGWGLANDEPRLNSVLRARGLDSEGNRHLNLPITRKQLPVPESLHALATTPVNPCLRAAHPGRRFSR